ncbi:uncharacterized protein LOC127095905 [Lathyrus oleraceus]|uniref:uncharacterized protein LOC127095905 n=1 Tax=Pisum sativum TaxID=3888 RepID=UPI0021D240B3|nr:uncharacterized protein LOC127095905 [Pisum sativum]
MAEPQERLLGNYGGANAPLDHLTIVNQLVNFPKFQLHPTTIRHLEKRPFTGKINEYANKHLQRFLTMSITLKIEGHTEEAKKLRMFPFTLVEDAKKWFYSLPAGSITTWEQMEINFLNEYFLAFVYIRKRYDVVNFKQKEGESLGDAYKRFKSSGNFTTTTSIKKIIEAIAANEHLELYDRSVSKPEGVIDLKLANRDVKIEEQVDAEVERRLKAMNIGTKKVAQVQPVQAVNCEICGGPHFAMQCVATAQQIEEISFLKQNNPYSKTYNPGWKNHPNFSWKDQKGNVQKQVQNLRHHENVNIVTTRSQKVAKYEEEKETNHDHVIEVDLEVRENKKEPEEVIPPVNPTENKNKNEAKSVIKLPYPQRVIKKYPKEKNFEKFITMFKKLEINMPLFEALEQMPMYQKFMKEVNSKKEPIGDGSVTFNENCSAIASGRRIPIKQKDPGSVLVSCTIKDKTFKKVLIDSGASVSLTPLSIYQRLGIGKVNDPWTNLKFADHSINNAYGIAEDINVTIEEFSFPVDFVIMDMPEDEETPIILGRPFMQTSQCNFDIEHGTLTLKVYNDEIILNMLENRKQKAENENHYQVGMIMTNVKGQSNMPTSEKVSRRPSQMVSPPLATLSEKTHISIPKPMRKKRKQYQGKDMEV